MSLCTRRLILYLLFYCCTTTPTTAINLQQIHRRLTVFQHKLYVHVEKRQSTGTCRWWIVTVMVMIYTHADHSWFRSSRRYSDKHLWDRHTWRCWRMYSAVCSLRRRNPQHTLTTNTHMHSSCHHHHQSSANLNKAYYIESKSQPRLEGLY